MLALACASSARAETSAPSVTSIVVDTSLAHDIPGAEPFGDHLVGVSRGERTFCSAVVELQRRVFPGSEEDGSIEVSPASVELDGLRPGSRYRHCVGIHNRQDEPMQYTISAVELIGLPSPEQPLKLVDPPTGPGAWIAVGERNLEVGPGERALVPWTITIPERVPTGSVAIAIRVEQGLETDRNASQVAIVPSVLQRIYLTFPGGTQRDLKVASVSAPRVLSRARRDRLYRAHFTVRNEGDIFESFDATLRVDGLGRGVGRGTAGPYAVLPGSAVRVVIDWEDLPWIGWYAPHATLTTRSGDVKVDLPRVLVLPPWQYLVALLAAFALPMVVLVTFIRRNRGVREDPDT